MGMIKSTLMDYYYATEQNITHHIQQIRNAKFEIVTATADISAW